MRSSLRTRYGRWVAPIPVLTLALFLGGCPGTVTPPDDNDNVTQPLPGDELLNVLKSGEGEVSEVANGSQVTVTATPAAGWIFTGWTGDVTGTDNPLVLTVTQAMEITAWFREDPAHSDADGDGVIDDQDDCPETPGGTQVDANGCPLAPDADNDGVADSADQCPGTPANTQVDSNGCPVTTADTDGDGVPNASDLCRGTPRGQAVDADGCSASQRDSDNDGVKDDRDQCADTPAGSQVDSDGCPSDAADSDNDGVANDNDTCPGTPAGAAVDASGCAASQRDSDGDGVNDDRDLCANTTPGRQVDSNGCPVAVPPGGGGGGGGGGGPNDDDGDGVTNDRDNCPGTPAGQPVDANGCPTDNPPGSDTCGRGNSACFSTATTPGCSDAACCQAVCAQDDFCCRADGQWDSTCVNAAFQLCAGAPSMPANNSCSSAIAIGNGSTEFNNINATTDGPIDGGFCAGVRVGADIWYTYTATCNGVLIVSLCGSAYDTTVAVYNGSGCPQEGAVACSDDDCGFGLESRATLAVTQGQPYTIRVGGFVTPQTNQAATGTGTLTLICGNDANNSQVCGAQGECFTGHETPGCSDGTCCTTVCNTDPYCCDVQWDDFCAQEAGGLCTGNFEACGAAGSTACNQAGNGPGCSQAACCNTVCMEDPYCCLQRWDSECVNRAAGRLGCP